MGTGREWVVRWRSEAVVINNANYCDGLGGPSYESFDGLGGPSYEFFNKTLTNDFNSNRRYEIGAQRGGLPAGQLALL